MLFASFVRFLKKRGKSPEDADDLTQEAFLRLEQYCRRGHEVACPEAFLRSTVMNLMVSEYRQERRYLQGRIELDGKARYWTSTNLGPQPLVSKRLVDTRRITAWNCPYKHAAAHFVDTHRLAI